MFGLIRAGEDETVIYFQNNVEGVAREYGTHTKQFLGYQYLLYKSLVWDFREARTIIEKLRFLDRELGLRKNKGLVPVWLEELGGVGYPLWLKVGNGVSNYKDGGRE